MSAGDQSDCHATTRPQFVSEPPPAQRELQSPPRAAAGGRAASGTGGRFRPAARSRQRALRPDRLRATRHRALDADHVGRGAGAHARDPRAVRLALAGDPGQRQGCDHHGRRRRTHRDLQSDRRAHLRLLAGRDPRPHARFPAARHRSARHRDFLERSPRRSTTPTSIWPPTRPGASTKDGSRVAVEDRGQQGESQSPRRLHGLHPRHHRAAARRAAHARERGALPHAWSSTRPR